MFNTLSYNAKAVSPTGKVHHVVTGAWKNDNVDPLCNHRNWLGYPYWGKPWKVVDKETPVTCKNCLSAAGEAVYKVKVCLGLLYPYAQTLRREKFKTKAEVDAYVRGLKHAKDWSHVEVDGKPI